MSTVKKYRRWVGGFALLVAPITGWACSESPSEDGRAVVQAQTPGWTIGQSYAPGDLVAFNTVIYKCLQGHVAQAGWEPANLPALWDVHDPGQAVPPPTSTGSLPAQPSIENVVVDVDCRQNPENCCPEGATSSSLTDGPDVAQILTPNECIIAGHGSDTLVVSSDGPSALHLGPGDDTAMDGPGDLLIFGGDGRDTINGHGGTNLFFGGAGDDTMMAANGTNTVVPGPGVDTVALGTGDDRLYIFDTCEVAAGETLDGGTGTNTLVSPVSLAALQAQGVTVTNFQNVVIESHSCWSECTQKPDCSNRGVCVEASQTGRMECACDAGWEGEDCSTPTDVIVESRGLEDLIEPSASGGPEISNFIRWAFGGGVYNGQKEALLALSPATLNTRLQEGLDKSELAMERFSLVYTASIVASSGVLPVFERVLEYEIPPQWRDFDMHHKSVAQEIQVVTQAVGGVYRLTVEGDVAARALFVAAAKHPWRSVRRRVAFLAAKSNDPVLLEDVRQQLPSEDANLINTRPANGTDLELTDDASGAPTGPTSPAMKPREIIVR